MSFLKLPIFQIFLADIPDISNFPDYYGIPDIPEILLISDDPDIPGIPDIPDTRRYCQILVSAQGFSLWLGQQKYLFVTPPPF